MTDHLRCPADHPEGFLVLLPDEIADRSVVRGRLGCPVCGRTFPVEHGTVALGSAPRLDEPATRIPPGGLGSLLGLTGPGGYVAIVGRAAEALAQEDLPGVNLVLFNPPPGLSVESASNLVGDRLGLRSGSVRGVVLGPGYGSQARWLEEARRVVLPGLRVVGEGPRPAGSGWEVLASADGVWVATPSGRLPGSGA